MNFLRLLLLLVLPLAASPQLAEAGTDAIDVPIQAPLDPSDADASVSNGPTAETTEFQAQSLGEVANNPPEQFAPQHPISLQEPTNEAQHASHAIAITPPRDSGQRRLAQPFSLANPQVRMVGSALCVVLGIFLFFVVINRILAPRRSSADEMIAVLGRTAVTPKHSLYLVRVQDRLILLAETPQGLQQLETIAPANPNTDTTASEKETAAPISDPESQRLLDMIRRQGDWVPTTEESGPRRTSYVA